MSPTHDPPDPSSQIVCARNGCAIDEGRPIHTMRVQIRSSLIASALSAFLLHITDDADARCILAVPRNKKNNPTDRHAIVLRRLRSSHNVCGGHAMSRFYVLRTEI